MWVISEEVALEETVGGWVLVTVPSEPEERLLQQSSGERSSQRKFLYLVKFLSFRREANRRRLSQAYLHIWLKEA